MLVKDNSTTLGMYQYNGLHWRTVKQGDSGGSAGHDQKREFIYSASWQPIQEEIDDYTNNGSPNGINSRAQTVWGLRYIDDAVLRRVNSNPGSDNDYLDSGDGTFYHLTDAQFSTVAMLEKTAKLMERVGYYAYGTAAHRWPGDVDNSNASTSADETAIDNLADMNGGLGVDITSGSYDVACDLNRDGVVNDTDKTQWSFVFGGARSTLGQAIASTIASGSTDNQHGYDGYVFNIESRAYLCRFRSYEPLLGRWWERDPVEYVDGTNLYAFVATSPLNATDPLGLLISFKGLSTKKDQDRLTTALKAIRERYQKLKQELDKIKNRLTACEKNVIGSNLDELEKQMDAILRSLDPKDTSIVVEITQESFTKGNQTGEALTDISVKTAVLGKAMFLRHGTPSTWTRTRLNTNPTNDWRTWDDVMLDKILVHELIRSAELDLGWPDNAFPPGRGTVLDPYRAEALTQSSLENWGPFKKLLDSAALACPNSCAPVK